MPFVARQWKLLIISSSSARSLINSRPDYALDRDAIEELVAGEMKYNGFVIKLREEMGLMLLLFVFAMVTSLIWRERNTIRFHQSKFEADHICREIVMHLHIQRSKIVKWKKDLLQQN